MRTGMTKATADRLVRCQGWAWWVSGKRPRPQPVRVLAWAGRRLRVRPVNGHGHDEIVRLDSVREWKAKSQEAT